MSDFITTDSTPVHLYTAPCYTCLFLPLLQVPLHCLCFQQASPGLFCPTSSFHKSRLSNYGLPAVAEVNIDYPIVNIDYPIQAHLYIFGLEAKFVVLWRAVLGLSAPHTTSDHEWIEAGASLLTGSAMRLAQWNGSSQCSLSFSLFLFLFLSFSLFLSLSLSLTRVCAITCSCLLVVCYRLWVSVVRAHADGQLVERWSTTAPLRSHKPSPASPPHCPRTPFSATHQG